MIKEPPDKNRPGKSCESSSSRKFRALQCPQNSASRQRMNRHTDIHVANVGVARSNPQILSAYPQSIAIHPQF